MANLVRIDYMYRDHGQIVDLIQTIFTTDVVVEWNAKEQFILLIWKWHQEDEVKKLLQLIRERFKNMTISIENGDREENANDKEEDVEEIKVSEVLEAPIPECESAKEAECETSDAETSLTPVDSVEILNEETKEEEIAPDVSKEVDEIPEVSDENILACESVESKTEVEAENIESENIEAKNIAPHIYSSKEYEAELKKLLGDLSKYDFKGDVPSVAAAFCSDYCIKSEMLKIAITIARISPDKEQLVKGIHKVTKKNIALVRVELNKSFKKWLSTEYPSFALSYPDIDVYSFLNIFREENRKF